MPYPAWKQGFGPTASSAATWPFPLLRTVLRGCCSSTAYCESFVAQRGMGLQSGRERRVLSASNSGSLRRLLCLACLLLYPRFVPEAHSRIATASLPKGVSLLLDVLRFAAACVVVLGHISSPEICPKFPHLLSAASVAVGFFFLLSGFVIQHTVTVKRSSLHRYAIERAARIYSVLVPALVLSVCLLAVRGAVVGDTWQTAGLSFLNYTQFWSHDLSVTGNGPVWSLGYEVPYYVLFGIYYFLGGWRRGLLIAVFAAAMGPTVFLLFPIWWAGTWLYKVLLTKEPSKSMGLATLAACTVGAVALVAVNGHIHLKIPLARAAEWPLFYAGGLLTAGCLAAGFAYRSQLAKLASYEKAIRFLAGATFSTYLFHLPILRLAASSGRFPHQSNAVGIALFFSVVAVCVLLSRFTEAKKEPWLRLFERIIPAGWVRSQAEPA